MSEYDLVVVGGGINGLGIAADAVLRGLRVLVVEKGDFGGGTTATSSRLAHGGLRYLQYGEIGLVWESLRERGLLARQWPHLVQPLELLIPSYRDSGMPAWKIQAGLTLYHLLARDPLFAAPKRWSPDTIRKREPGLRREGLVAAYTYPDAQLTFPERLCVELAGEIRSGGGVTLNHTVVTEFVRQGDHITGVRYRDLLTGAEEEVASRIVINAAGPWVDAVNRLLPQPPPKLIGGTWGTHVVLPARPAGPQGPLYAAAKRDGRPFFILPWAGRLLVGTTDVKFEGNPDEVAIEAWEIEYLLEETNELFPECNYQPEDVHYTTIGVRPLPASDRAAGAITRRHFLVDHGREHQLYGLASVVGGKITTYRSLGETTVDWVLRALNRPPVPCPTRSRTSERLPDMEALRRDLRELGTTEPLVTRLISLYGPHAREIAAQMASKPELARPLAEGSSATVAEVLHAVRYEAARTVDDIARRRLMLLPPSPAELAGISEVCEQHSIALAPS